MLYGTTVPPLCAFWYFILSDTIYACQDIKDDVKVGVCSTAILFGNRIRRVLTACAVTFVGMLALAGYINQQGLPYFVISVGGTGFHLVWQFFTVDLDAPESCWRKSTIHSALRLCPLTHPVRQLWPQRTTRLDYLGWFNGRLRSDLPVGILRTLKKQLEIIKTNLRRT